MTKTTKRPKLLRTAYAMIDELETQLSQITEEFEKLKKQWYKQNEELSKLKRR